MTSEMQHKGQATAGLSGAVWGNLPVKNWACRLGGQFRMVNGDGMAMQDDGSAWADGKSNLGFISEQQTGSTITVVSDVTNSHNAATIKLLTDGTDADNCALQTELPVINIASGAGRWAFEARIKPSTIADSVHNFYFGLTSAALAGNSTVVAGDLADISAVGFLIQEGDGDDIRGVISDASDGAGITNMNVSTDNKYLMSAADLYYHLGAVYDGMRIKLYVTGVKSGETVAKSVLLHEATEGADEYPSTTDTDMYLFAGIEAAATGSDFEIEWLAYGQEFIDF